MSYDAAPVAEELQLLGQLGRAPLRITHSATLIIAARLDLGGDAMLITQHRIDWAIWLEITAQGRRRLAAALPAARCPFCGTRPVPSPSGTQWMHPGGGDCILRDYATGNFAAWNHRPGGQG